MPRGENLAKDATPESRAKGGRARAAKLRAERQEAERQVEEKLVNALDRAVAGLLDALDAEGVVVVGTGENAAVHPYALHAVRIRAANALLDRVLGRPRQTHEHSGHLELGVDVDLARSKLDSLIAKRGAK